MPPTAEGAADALDHARLRTQMLLDAVRRQHARLAYVSSFTTLPDLSGASNAHSANGFGGFIHISRSNR